MGLIPTVLLRVIILGRLEMGVTNDDAAADNDEFCTATDGVYGGGGGTPTNSPPPEPPPPTG